MSPAAEIEGDPSVCYRHPDRASWTLCERCGRTICPECQILTPSGVRCPDCVRELGGSVQWTPAGGSRASAAKAKKRRAARRRDLGDRPAWQQVVSQLFRPGDATPSLSWLIAGLAVIVGIIGFFSDIPATLLAALPSVPWQVWRYVTAAVVNGSTILGFVLNIVFFLLIAPTAERELGRRNFLIVFFSSTIAGNALAVITGNPGFGLYGALYGLFGATLILVWPSPAARNRLLVLIGINVLITIILSPFLLPEVIGGIIGGTGATYVLRRFEDTPRFVRRGYLIIGGGLLVLVAIAILRGVLT